MGKDMQRYNTRFVYMCQYRNACTYLALSQFFITIHHIMHSCSNEATSTTIKKPEQQM